MVNGIQSGNTFLYVLMKPFRLTWLLALALALSCEKDESLPAPVITSFSPTSGPLGTEITINGSNFDSNIEGNQVKINGADVTVINASTSSLTVRVDHGVSSGKLTVEVHSKTVTSHEVFNLSCLLLFHARSTGGDTDTWTYIYNDEQQLVRVDAHQGNFFATYEYDDKRRLKRYSTSLDGIVGHEDYHYNDKNQVTHITSPLLGDEAIVTFQYNSSEQLIQRENLFYTGSGYEWHTTTFEYPNPGVLNPSSWTSNGGTTLWEYDNNSNPFFVITPWDPQQQSNNPTKMEVVGWFTVLFSYTYNHSGYPSTTTENTVGSGSTTVTWSYDCDY